MFEFTLKNKKHKKINIIEGNNIKHIKAIIIHIHGIGSHFQPLFDCIDDFKNRDDLFIKFNYKSFGLEFHGHGKSDGTKCSIDNFDDLIDDINIIVNFIKKIYKQPIFLLCESMGCAIALKYCIEYKNNIKGIIFLGPLFLVDDNLKPHFLIILILTIISHMFPEFPLLTSDGITINNQNFIEARKNNYFSYNGKHRLNTGREMLKISDWINNNGHLLETPILIFHGLKDQINNPETTKIMFDKIISKDKELNLIEDGYHCLLIEPKENPFLPGYIVGKIVYWMNERAI
jgi:alpha-beta hydrolase superfamily lysophospholipase